MMLTHKCIFPLFLFVVAAVGVAALGGSDPKEAEATTLPTLNLVVAKGTIDPPSCGSCTTFQYVATGGEHPSFITHRFGSGGGVSLEESEAPARIHGPSDIAEAITPLVPATFASWVGGAEFVEADCEVAPWQRCYSIEGGTFRCDSEGCHENYAPSYCSLQHSRCSGGGGESEDAADTIVEALASVENAAQARVLVQRIVARHAFLLNDSRLDVLGCDGATRAKFQLNDLARVAFDEVLSSRIVPGDTRRGA